MNTADSEEVGGYFGLTLDDRPHNVAGAQRFATLRQGLAAVMRAIAEEHGGLSTLALPAMICPDVVSYLKSAGMAAAIEAYHLDENLAPVEKPDRPHSYRLHSNFFGLSPLREPARHTIVDNAHGFFEEPMALVSTLYSARKFLAVPDGAYLYSSEQPVPEPATDWTQGIPAHMAIRSQSPAQDGFDLYRTYEDTFRDYELGDGMSAISRLLVQGSDLTQIAARRRANFEILHRQLGSTNELRDLIERRLAENFVPYHYPYLVSQGELLRRRLHEARIWVPTLWPLDSFEFELSTWERRVVASTVHLPVDQRYGPSHMARTLEVLSG